MILILIPVLASGATDVRLLAPAHCDATDAILQYDDGTAWWLTWGGLYRGVWFDCADFEPGAAGIDLAFTEYWFYHHASYPWDISSFYAELWTGDDQSGPLVRLDQTSVTAMHMTPAMAYYDPPVAAPADFWAVVNTEMSSGGWPSLACDASPVDPPHSFQLSGSGWAPAPGDYLVRAGGDFLLGLEDRSWGSIKTLFEGSE